MNGFKYLPNYLSKSQQDQLVGWAMSVAEHAPWYTPAMYRTGKSMSVRMTCAGVFGWMSDQANGYRYEPHHPFTGTEWPAITSALIDLWHTVGDYGYPPECCLINWYTANSKMGQHVDRDEDDQDAPVVSVSIGDTAVFRLGGLKRGGSTQKVNLNSGDVMVLGGPARFAYHGIDRIRFGSSQRVPEGGRLNFTLRRVTKPRI